MRYRLTLGTDAILTATQPNYPLPSQKRNAPLSAKMNWIAPGLEPNTPCSLLCLSMPCSSGVCSHFADDRPLHSPFSIFPAVHFPFVIPFLFDCFYSRVLSIHSFEVRAGSLHTHSTLFSVSLTFVSTLSSGFDHTHVPCDSARSISFVYHSKYRLSGSCIVKSIDSSRS